MQSQATEEKSPQPVSRFPQDPILVVDDEVQFLQSALFALRTSGLNNVVKCDDSRKVMETLSAGPYSAVLLDILMPHLTGRDLLPQISAQFPGLPVVMLTALNEIDTAVACIKSGAFDYLVKPVDKTRLVTSLQRAIEFTEMKQENSRLKEQLLSGKPNKPEAFSAIVTCSQSMRSIFQYIEAIASTSLPALVTGETGSGKELIAKAIHDVSGRKGEFVAVNVAGLDDSLFTDTLFGHEKGAFTGAERPRPGLVARAAGGTLFLDEIGDLKMESQVKLLRLLEERTYYPVGSDTALRTDARVVVATNCDLLNKQKRGEFRSDLYYRLVSHHIRIPPLRSRKEDLPLLVETFIERAASELGKKPPTPPEELILLLNTYHFPGNIRELKGMVYDAVSRHTAGMLSMDVFKEHLAECCEGQTADGNNHYQASHPTGKVIFTDQLPTLKEIEDLLVQEALTRSSGNQSIAASMLGLTRSALNKRINRKD